VHSEEERKVDLAVVGGGITGLAAAWTAAAEGFSVVLLESSDRFGGSVITHRANGYTIEGGPHTLLVNDQEVEDFLQSCGLWDQAIESQPGAAKRFVVRDGRPAALPSSLPSFLTGSFLSVPGKLRLLMEPFLQGKGSPKEEAMGPWVKRHFGREVSEGLADPFISGIFAGDPEKISLQAAFPELAKIAGLHPSLIRSFLKKKKISKADGVVKYPRRMLSFPEGLAQMIGHLSRKGSFRSLAGSRLRSISKDKEGWFLQYRTGSEEAGRRLRANRILIAVPPHVLPELPFADGIKSKLAEFSKVESPPVTTFSIAYRREDVTHPLDGFGVLAPSRESREVLGILFDSSLFPGRAPAGEVLLSAFLGGVRNAERGRLDTETILRLVRKECRELLGAHGEPTYWKSTFWPRAIPQYNLGYHNIAANLNEIEAENHGLAFAGNARDGVSLGACILSGIRRARDLSGK